MTSQFTCFHQLTTPKLLLSFAASTTLLTLSNSFSRWLKFALSPLILVATIACRSYIKKYWAPHKASDGKDIGTRVPLPKMEDYNEAERMTERLLEVLQYLEYSWVAASFFGAVNAARRG